MADPGVLLNQPSIGLRPDEGIEDWEKPVPSTIKPQSPADVIQPPKPKGLALTPRQLPVNRRRIGDPLEIRRLIYDNVLQQASNIEPVKNARYTLSLHDLHYADPEEFPLKEQKEAILGGKTLYRRLKGTWRLSNTNTGEPVDEKRMTIAQVPHMNDRGTFILKGTEYTLSHQMRLRPGIFVRIKANGEVEAHANFMPGKGVIHHYFFEPETSVFKINVGQSRVPLLPVLKAMGVPERQIRNAWGNEIYAINAQHDSPHVIDKLYERLVRRADPRAPHETKSQALAQELNRMELDPEVTKRTLGTPYKNLTADAILATTKKLLAVNKREADPDDRDHLAYQHLMGPEDLIAERIGKDKMTFHKLLWHASSRSNLEHIQPGSFTKAVMAAFLTSGLGQAAEEVNAAELLDHQGRITRLGEGGIKDAQSVPEECYDEETEVFTYNGWKPWSEVTSDTRLACLMNGQLEFHKPIRLMKYGHDGPMYGAKTRTINYLVTPNHQMWCRSYGTNDGTWKKEFAQDVHGKYRQFQIAHSPYVGNPFITSYSPPEVDGARIVYRNIPIGDWAELVGWIIAEGNIDKYALAESKKYKFSISQCNLANPDKVQRIAGLLAKIGIPFSYRGHNFSFVSKQLGVYFSDLGVLAHEKHLPHDFIDWPVQARRRLFDSLVAGDGHEKSNGVRTYTSSSKKLMEQVSMLATSLGTAVRECNSARKYENSNHRDSYSCRTLLSQAEGITYRKGLKAYYTTHYKGPVYCAEVPGGLLLVRRQKQVPLWCGNSRNVHPSQMAFVDPVKTPESFKAGVDLRTAFGVQKGTDGRLYAPFHDPRRGRTVYRSPQELSDLVVAFPGELETGRPMVAAMSRGKLRYVPRNQIDLVLPTMENAFSPLSNMVPMKSAVKGQRVSMGARMLSQALPLMTAEAPLVQSAAPIPSPPGEKISFEQLYGQRMGPVRATQDGVVSKITADGITVRHDNGSTYTYELYNHHPYNRKTYLHNTPLIQEGQRFQAGQFLAKSNYTDDEGVAALGLNARVAYLPFHGLNYEDAAVISESMAKRMTSEHMYQRVGEFGEGVHRGKNAFVSLFPGKYPRKMLEQMDEHGVVKPGTIVKTGDPLILIAAERERAHNQVHRSGKSAFSDNSLTWDHNTDGQVTDVVHTRNGALVAIKSYTPMQVGDKLSGRYGDKGVISEIIPDERMPHGEDGKPFEILVSPMGLISRINSAQAMEAALGKIANKTGRPYKVEDFNPSVNLTQYAINELKKHGMSDTETVIDPTNGRRIPNVLAGHRFFMKLQHTSECFDSKTEALTVRGWVPWPEVKEDDLLATVDNGQLVFEKPIKLHQSYHRGDLYCYEGRYLNYAVTGNHRLYGKYYYRKGGNNFELACKVHGRRFCVPQFGFKPDESDIGSSFHIGNHDIEWNDYAELIAWWASEGYAKVTDRRACVVLYQSEEANPGHFARIEQLASRLPFNWHYYRSKGKKLGIILSNRDLAVYLRQYGTHSNNKRLPRLLFAVPVEARILAIQTMMRGDGYRQETKTGPTEKYTTVSKGLADDFQELCIRSGLGAIVRAGRPPRTQIIRVGNRSYVANCQQEWTCGVALSRTIALIDGDRNKAGFSIKRYNGPVYCAEMRTGLLYVRRNGKPMLSGNSKSQGRGAGGGYTAEGLPSKGGETGSKRVSLMDTNALLAHGATDVLKDAHVIRGQRNEDYWLNFMAGKTPPEPKVPFIYEKFLNELKAAGINVVRDARKLHVMPLIDRDIEQLTAGRELKNTDTVDWKEGLKPVKGGLFDPGITGGHGGNRWAKIPLYEPMPNPVMEEPIRRLLGLTEAGFLDILSGKKALNGQKGPHAITNALKGLNVDKEIARAKAEIASGKKSYRDAAVRRLQYLESAQKMGLHPGDWVVNSVPVLPPTFRPVSMMQGKYGQIISDPNFLYREVWDANQGLKNLHGLVDDVSEERLNLYNAFKGVTGLGDPIQPKNVEKKVKGLLKHIFGTNPKFSTVQFKLLGASVNLVGRGVIVPNPDIDMDSIGLPEHRVWEVYRPFIIRGLVRSGMPGVAAVQAVQDKTKAARDVMLKVMQERPVLVNRYPVLHRYGLMAFWPKLIHGETIQVSPIITKGFGADFDGDTMQYHVPASEDARKDAIAKMLPSANLYAGASFKVNYIPNQEFVQGLHAASHMKEDGPPRRVFATRKDALNAYRRGDINLGTPIEVLH